MIEITPPTVELQPQAGGGGNFTRPPSTVITGDHPDDRYERLRRQLDALQHAAERQEALRREAEKLSMLQAWADVIAKRLES